MQLYFLEVIKAMVTRQICTLSVCAALILITAAALGQANTGTISGTVSDPSAAAIPGAQITATNIDTGQSRETISNGSGYFTFALMQIGHYQVKIEAQGFKSITRNDLTLLAGKEISLPLKLQVGAVSQTVTISGAPPALNTTNPAQVAAISGASIHQLPLANQDWTNIVTLGNGVSTGGSGGATMNGLPPASMNLTVDGTNATPDPEVPALGQYGGFDTIHIINFPAIAQITVTKGVAPASAGVGMEGNINVITKSGTNQFHGSLFELNGNAAYDAQDEFEDSKTPYNFNEYGGSIGGPILKNRLFFFGSYEGVKDHQFSRQSSHVLTPEFMEKVAAEAPEYLPILQLFPAPNEPYEPGASTGRYSAPRPEIHTDGNGVARLDYYLNSTNHVYLRYTRARPYQLHPDIIPVEDREYLSHNDLINAQYTHSGTFWTASTRFGYNRLVLQRLDLGYLAGLPDISVDNFGTNGAENFNILGKIYTLQEDVTIQRGNHTIAFGGIFQRNGDGRIDDSTTEYDYSSESDFFNNIPSKVEVNFALSKFWIHTYQIGGYIQDDYRITPNLTLNAGIRYDYFTVPKEKDGRFFTRNASPLGPGTGSLRPPNQLYKSDWKNFAPRLGFAWKTGHNGSTVVHSGFGVFFTPLTIRGGPIDDVLDSPYVPFRLTLDRAQTLEMGLNYPIDKVALQQKLIDEQNPVITSALDNNLRNPYSMQWTLDVQHELKGGFVVDVGYIGTRGLRLLFPETTNLPDRLTGISPAPQFGEFRYYVGQDFSNYNALQTSVQRQFQNGLNIVVNYTWARAFTL
ncbi:MAG: TonB-dependent receptor, partial [Acidobacteriaceae bacterium]